VSSSHQVIIAGAGPAGVAVAVRLAQLGRSNEVLVIDRYRFPRDKPCGGGLTGHMDPVMDALGLQLRVSHVACPDAVVRFGSLERRIAMGKSVDVIRRSEFDADLVKQAKDLGIRIIEGEGITEYERSGDDIVVHTSGKRRLHCKVLVGADGAASKVRKQILQRKKAIPHRLFMCEMNVLAPAHLNQAMTYDFSLMSQGLRGYLWLFPAPEGRLNVGLMHYPDPQQVLGGRALTELLREGLAPYGVALPTSGVRGWPAWGYHPGTPISEPGVLAVGDAAGIDGLTGEGIAVAMEQALVAGDCIDEALRSDDVSFASYGRRIRKATVGRELALDRWLAKLLYSSKHWKDWLSLVLLDDKVLDMYARRVDGMEVLADQKLRLYSALWRHGLRRGARLRELDGLVRS
jgi:menaquinone-9 beta-reductase